MVCEAVGVQHSFRETETLAARFNGSLTGQMVLIDIELPN